MDDPNMHAYGGEGPDDAEIGRRWREDSSLEKWFPLTAERLVALEAENAALKREASPAFRLHGHHSATPPRPVISDRAVCLGAMALAALALLIVNLI